MRSFKFSIVFILTVTLMAGISFGQKSKPKIVKPKPTPVQTSPAVVKKDMPSETQNVEYALYSEGSSGLRENKPFIYVARNRETYAVLKSLFELNPTMDVDFSKFALVAAFRDTKPTGGYSVSISGHTVNDMYVGTKATIAAKDPAPGQIVTDALTSPFKVVLIPVSEEKTLELEIGPEWKNSAEVYQITSGNFEFSGGFAFVERKFELGGEILIWRSGDMITCAFSVAGKGAETARRLSETASGTIGKDGSVVISQIDPGGFVNNPRPALKATGKITGTKLSLEFISLPTGWSDGFTGHGKLEAAKQNK